MVRVRFAPSPTGFLHVGGARTALFNWLYARHTKGVFILRIEDTDAERSTDESTQVILDSMKWMGLDWDEGPFYQSQRMDLYKQTAQRLLDEDKAYYCFCSAEVLDQKRKLAMQEKRPPRYDGTCSHIPKEEALKRIAAGEKAVLRFRKLEGFSEVDDIVRGKVTFDNNVLDDFIILRTDGSPIYNFCVVCDDVDMKITHVIRGEDHLSNTPRQIMLYKALGYPTPQFAHISMILGPDKQKLSKRHGAVSVLAFRDEGYLPEAIMNYLALLGWAFDDKAEFFTQEELIEKFSLEHVSKNPAVFDYKKCGWMNSHYISHSSFERLMELLKPEFEKENIDVTKRDSAWWKYAIDLEKQRAAKIEDIAKNMHYYLDDTIPMDPKGIEKHLSADKSFTLLTQLLESIKSLDPYTIESLEKVFQDIVAKEGIKLGEIVHPVRVSLSGKTVGPGIFELLLAMGKDMTIHRMQEALKLQNKQG